MKCLDPKMKKLVSLYQFDMLEEEEKRSVEDHLLECDACFEEVYRLTAAVEMIQEQPENFLDALKPKETSRMRITNSLKKYIRKLSGWKNCLLVPMAEWWRKPAIKIVVPAAVLALLLVSFVAPINMKFSKLAIIENGSYLAAKVRGLADEFSSTQNLYDEGMKCYQEKNYRQAIQKLSICVKRKKEDAHVQFYLGVSYLLTDEYKKGIKYLESATELSQKQNKEVLLEQCHWHLGNAYLKINEVEKAVKEFRNVIVIGGDYKDEALIKIVKIEELKAE